MRLIVRHLLPFVESVNLNNESATLTTLCNGNTLPLSSSSVFLLLLLLRAVRVSCILSFSNFLGVTAVGVVCV